MRGKARGAAILLACVVLASCSRGAPPKRTRTETGLSGDGIAISILSRAVYVVDPETQRATTLAEGLTDFQAGFAAWAPDHRSIAYGDDGILIADPATEEGRVLVRGPSVSMPAWSPDGRSIAYGDGRDLWVTPVRALRATYLRLPLSLAPLDMSWAPAGVIAFTGLALLCHVPFGCSSTSRSDVWAVRPDGTALRRVTSLGDAEEPRWSPHGSRLLFVRRRSEQLWVSNANGSDPQRLGGAPGVLAADWSPDGSRIALARAGRAPGTVELWVMGADGADLRQIGRAFAGTAASVDW
jgi:Tol biopolymer transport system component